MKPKRKLQQYGIIFKGKIYCNGEPIKQIDAKGIDDFIKEVSALRCKCK